MSQDSSVRRIGVFRALQLGDLLCAIPAFRALRQQFPLAEITLIGLPWSKVLLERYPAYFDRFIPFSGYDGLPEQPYNERIYRVFLRELPEFDLLLQMQGNGTIVNDMMASWPARYRAGFYPRGGTAPGALFTVYPDQLPEPLRHLHLMQFLGMKTQEPDLEFPVYAGDKAKMRQLISFRGIEKDYVCIHPGSRGSWRQWPPVFFSRVADACVRAGYQVLVTGTEAEKEITRKVISLMNREAVDLTGATDLGCIGALIAGARLLIANCTGVSHLASALRTPSIILSMDGDPMRWGPVNRKLHQVIDVTRARDLPDTLNDALTHLEVMLEQKSETLVSVAKQENVNDDSN